MESECIDGIHFGDAVARRPRVGVAQMLIVHFALLGPFWPRYATPCQGLRVCGAINL